MLRLLFLLLSVESYRHSFRRFPSRFFAVAETSNDDVDVFDGMFQYALEKVKLVEDIRIVESRTETKSGQIGNKTIKFSCISYSGIVLLNHFCSANYSNKSQSLSGSRLISVFRLVTFKGAGFNVFNLLALPRVSEDNPQPIPILGIDLVMLPGSALAAIGSIHMSLYINVSNVSSMILTQQIFNRPTMVLTFMMVHSTRAWIVSTGSGLQSCQQGGSYRKAL